MKVYRVKGQTVTVYGYKGNGCGEPHEETRPDEFYAIGNVCGVDGCWWRDGDTDAQWFRIGPSGEVVWGKTGMRIPDFDSALDARVESIEGRGYSGGHRTADRLGWETTYPYPPDGTLIWWDDTFEGAFTGFYPRIKALVADISDAAHKLAAKKIGFSEFKKVVRENT